MKRHLNLNLQTKQKIKRVAALLLSFVLLFDALEISAPAPVVRAMENGFGAFCAVTAFAELPKETREQTLPTGAKESDIVLPKSLSATVSMLADQPEPQTEETQGAAGTEIANALAGMDQILPPAEELPVIDGEAQPAQQPRTQTEAAPAISGTDGLTLTIDSIEEVPYEESTALIDGVKWSIDKERSDAEEFLSDEEHAGAVYTYVAVLPEKDSKGNTILLQDTAKLPEITVTVGGQKTETEELSETQNEFGTEKEAETGAEEETGSDEAMETEEETEAESVTEAERETEAAQTEIEKTTEPETEELTEAQSETEELTEAESETETETETETENETDAEEETGSDKVMEETESETETETELTAEEETETETEAITEAETEMETEASTEFESEMESEFETEEPMYGLMSLGDEPMMISEGDGTGIDLRPYITDVEFTWTDGSGIRRPIEEKNGQYEFPEKTNIGFKLRYHMPKGVVTPENNIVTYELPATFKYQEGQNGNIVWDGGKDGIAGTYKIENGKVILTFDENTGFFDSDTDFTGYVTFDGRVDESADHTTGEVVFKDDVKFSYTITEEEGEKTSGNDSSFNAEKSAKWVDGKLQYTINVTAGQNGATNVILKDAMSAQVNSGEKITDFIFDATIKKNGAGDGLQPLKDWNTEGVYTEGTPGDPETVENGWQATKYPYLKDGKVYYHKTVVMGNEWWEAYRTVTPEDGYYIQETLDDGTNVFYLPDLGPYETYTITYEVDVWQYLQSKGINYNSTWDSYYIKNTLNDFHNTHKDENVQARTNTWLKKYTQGEVKLNEDGQYEIGWKVEINPDHHDLSLDTLFSDILNLKSSTGGAVDGAATNDYSNGKITVTDEKYQPQYFDLSTLPADILEQLQSGGNITIEKILEALGLLVEGTKTTKYAISVEYTTKVDANKLPEGATTVTNTASLSKGGTGTSASASVGLQNTSLQKEVNGKARLSDGTDGAEKDVLLIPWKAMVKMNAKGVGTNYASIEDVFGDGEKLWVTPEYLQKHLHIFFTHPDGSKDKEVAAGNYKLYYKTADSDAYKEYTGGDDNSAHAIGFKIVFEDGTYDEVAGKILLLEYELFGDTSFLNGSTASAGTAPKQTFTNTVYYCEKNSSASYEVEGDSFNKQSAVGYDVHDNHEWSLESLPNGHITWWLDAKISGFLEKDFTITDTFPKNLELYSVTVQRNYGNAGMTDTEIISEKNLPLEFNLPLYTLEWNGDKNIIGGDKKITIKIYEKDGEIVIEATIPKELIGAEYGQNWFILNVEAKIPEDADLLNPTKETVNRAEFVNKGSLTVDGNPRGEDTDTVTVTTDKSILKKDGILAEAGNIMHYTLEANRSGLKRLEGDGTTPLTLTDTLKYKPNQDDLKEQYQVELVPDSVKAYYYKEGQKVYLPADGYDFSYKYEVTNGADGYRNNTLTMKIPDALAVYIEYDYRLSSEQTIPWEINNSASLEGVTGAQAGDQQSVSFSGSSAGVEKTFVNFYKVDQDNYNIGLPGAEFVLYAWKTYGNGNLTLDQVKEAAKSHPEQYVEDDEGYWEAYTDDEGGVKSFVSDSTGLVPIKAFMDSHNMKMNPGTLYWLEEKNAPAGYELQMDKTGYYFYLVDGTKEGVAPTIPSSLSSLGAQRAEVHELSGANTIYIPNKPSKLGSITARKIWADGTDPAEVKLTLYKGYTRGYTYKDTTSSVEGQEPKLTQVEREDNPATLPAFSSDGEWTVTWDDLPQKDESGRQIYYYVFETMVDGKGEVDVLEDGSYYIDNYSVEYDNNIGLKSGTVTITNSTTSISVEKVWADEPAVNHSGDEIKVGLYQSFTPPMSKEEAEKPKKLGVNLRSDDNDYWNRNQVVYETDGISRTYADDYGFKDVTSDTVEIELELKPADQVLTEDSVEFLCSDKNVAYNLKEIKQIKDRYEYRFVWEVSNITKESEFYIYVKAHIYAQYDQNTGVTITELPSRGIGPQHPEDLELIDQVTLNREKVWEHEWKNLPKVAQDPADGVVKPVYYYVEEEYFEGYASTYKYEYTADGTIFRGVTITNSPEDETKTSVSVEKKWVNSSNEKMEPGTGWQVKVQLWQRLDSDGAWEPYSGGDAIVTLSQDNIWTYSWKDLPLGEYCVKEIEGKEGFTVFYESKSTTEPQEADNYQNAAVSRGKITVINKAPETQIEVEKKWNGIAGESVRMQLYRSTIPPAKEPETTQISVNVAVTSWLKPDSTEGNRSDRGSITVKFYECDDSGSRIVGKEPVTVILNSQNDWNTTVNLDGVTTYSDESKVVHFYQVEYEPDSKYIADVSNKPADILPGNTNYKLQLTAKLTDVAVAKTVILHFRMENEKGEILEEYGRKNLDIEQEIMSDRAVVKIAYENYVSSPNYEKIRFEPRNLLVDEPTFTKNEWPNSNYLEYELDLSSVTESPIEVYFYYTCPSDPWPLMTGHTIEDPASSISYTSNFGTRLMSIPGGSGSAGGELVIPRKSDGSVDGTTVGEAVTLDANTEWKHSWDSLPQYDPNGNKLYYYVEELDTGNYKSTEYTYDYIDDEPWKGIEKVTVTNTLPEPSFTTTTVEVTKEWKDYNGGLLNTEAVENFEVEVQLQRRTKAVNQQPEDGWSPCGKIVTLTQSNKWRYSWSELDWQKFDEKRALVYEYEYRVREVKVKDISGSEVNNFETTYSPNISTSGGYEFTITNTKKRQGITLPGTGSKYPWIFYGIGMTFMLIALVWMRRALKKSYIPSDTGKGGRRSDE